MTEEAIGKSRKKAAKALLKVFATQDYFLTILQMERNDKPEPDGLAITLTLPGILVMGRMVSAETWAERVAEACGEAAIRDGQARESGLGKFFRGWREGRASGREHRAANREAALDPASVPGYVYLLDAQFFNGASLMPEHGIPWRGRIVQVVGWSLGLISA